MLKAFFHSEINVYRMTLYKKNAEIGSVQNVSALIFIN